MRVDIIGGGPAGLLLAILLRRDGVADDVRVFERHEPDVTYGWGVVFPEGALAELERADHPTFAAVMEAGTTWTPMEIRFKSTRLRVNGNSFHGISRRVLLSILRENAASLGVRLAFDRPVTDLDAHRDADVLVGADGVNSLVRNEFSEIFQPRIERSAFKHIWFGIDHNFRDFTYIFRETEWGLFRAYCYPVGQSWSSLIVHISEDTWRGSGLARLNETESIRRCAEIFADDLAGKAILSNRSHWTNFTYVRCRAWHHENVVLIGDAAHTAHWSIGAGTRLAMEDAIALATQLAAHSHVPTALARFEAERRATVERFQEASRRSERYFENLPRYFGFEPIQFAYQLTTRSWRITHGAIAKRDNAFVADFNRWFYARSVGKMADIAPSPALAPVRIGEAVFANRIATADAADGSGLIIGSWPERSGPPRAGDAAAAAVRVPRADSPDAYREMARRAAGLGYTMILLDLATDPLRGHSWAEALSALRSGWPTGRPVGVALAVGRSRDTAGDGEEFVALARSLALGGADVVLLEPARWAPGAADAIRLAQVADVVRNEAGISVIVDGAADSLEEAHTIVAAGLADMCVLPTPLDVSEGGLSVVA